MNVRRIGFAAAAKRSRVGRWAALLSIPLLMALFAPRLSLSQKSEQEPPKPPAKQTYRVAMRDGVRLATDVYLPPGEGPFPVVLARTPYNKDGAQGLAQSFVSRGYALVVQDTRGRYASEGENRAFEADGWVDGKQDGYDTVEWVAQQPWCNGKVGTWGGSALGITQYLMAGTAPRNLVCQYVVVGTANVFQTAYRGGVFHKALVEDWLRITKFDSSQLKTWIAHSTEDDYWQARDLAARWGKVNVPAVHVGGWYDIFTQGTIDAFLGYQTRGGPGARGKQKLIMGPWTHGVNQRKAGQITFPPNATAPPNDFGDQWRWYERWLKGVDNRIDREPAIAYYVMGDTTDPNAPGNVWRTTNTWPPPSKATPYYLHTDRTLSTKKPEGEKFLEYTYDPKNPVPTTGGNHLTLPAGPMDQNVVETRPDVLVFTSAPLEKPLEVTGRVRVRLWVSSDAPDTDFTARLCDVYPDGRSMNICDGILRMRFRKSFRRPELMQPGKVYPIEIDLWSTSILFNKGHRLRVQVSSSNAPAYDPNPNTGEPFRASDRTQVARNRVYLDSRRPSHILLPIVADGQGEGR